jgi:hypothetical protein
MINMPDLDGTGQKVPKEKSREASVEGTAPSGSTHAGSIKIVGPNAPKGASKK